MLTNAQPKVPDRVLNLDIFTPPHVIPIILAAGSPNPYIIKLIIIEARQLLS